MSMAEEMKKITEDISTSYEERVDRISQLKKETEETLKSSQDLLKTFQDSHQKMSWELRENLAKNKEDRSAEVHKLLGEAQRMMDDFKTSHQKMSEKLNEDLVNYNQGIKSEVSSMLTDFHKVQEEIKADLKEMSTSWRKLASSLQEKRSGAKPVSEVSEVKVAKEEIPEEVEIKEEAKESEEEKEQVLNLINSHPEGIKLAEIGAEMGKDWRWYIAITKELIEENKIKKEDNLYYPI
ncbi:MAG: hypothetical protein PHP36_00660 [Atribacterota bacterium]|jgi:hypothetical protein|nr:hypothetical protein [Atribacterota bacterium]